MGFTKNNPPYYLRPLLDEYAEVNIKECGYSQGSWAKLIYHNKNNERKIIKFRREVTNNINISVMGSRTNVKLNSKVNQNDYTNVKERDVLIGKYLSKVLGGYETFEDALDSLE